jgi:hypothetical protein
VEDRKRVLHGSLVKALPFRFSLAIHRGGKVTTGGHRDAAGCGQILATSRPMIILVNSEVSGALRQARVRIGLLAAYGSG